MNNNIMEVIYPIKERHYEGCISKTKYKTYLVRIRTRNLVKTLNTYEKAFEYLKN